MTMNEMVMDVMPFSTSGGIRTSYSSLRSYSYGQPTRHRLRRRRPGTESPPHPQRRRPRPVEPQLPPRGRQKTDTTLTTWTVNSVTAATLTIPENQTASNIIPLTVPPGIITPASGKASRHEIALLPIEIDPDLNMAGVIGDVVKSVVPGSVWSTL